MNVKPRSDLVSRCPLSANSLIHPNISDFKTGCHDPPAKDHFPHHDRRRRNANRNQHDDLLFDLVLNLDRALASSSRDKGVD